MPGPRRTPEEDAIRVLILLRDMHPRQGGPPQVAAGSALALKRLGVDVEIAAMVAPGEDDEVRAAWTPLEGAGIPLHLFAMSQPFALGRSAALDRFITDNAGRFDLLHAHGVWEMILARASRVFRKAAKPYVVSPHGMLDRWSMARSRTKKRIAWSLFGAGAFLKRADVLIYGTADEADEASVLALPGQVRIVPNGVDPSRLTIGADQGDGLRGAFPQIAGWTRTLLFFSRIHPKKGLDLLVEAFSRVAPDYPGTGLLAAGIAEDEAYEASLHRRVEALGLADRVVLTTAFTGAAGRAAFGLADIFVLPSFQEGFSMAIVEAMGLGKPVLITDRCHLGEVAAWGAGAVSPATADGLEAGLRTLLASDDDALKAMGARGAAVVRERFTWESVGLQLQQVYSAAKRTGEEA